MMLFGFSFKTTEEGRKKRKKSNMNLQKRHTLKRGLHAPLVPALFPFLLGTAF